MKKFLIIGNTNAVAYKDVFPYVKANEVKLGYIKNVTMKFVVSDEYEQYNEIIDGKKYVKVTAISWFTNLNVYWNSEIELTESYWEHPERYPKYDNYDAIEVSKTKDIPYDYDGVMGVPITFLCKYNPDQFEIKVIAASHSYENYKNELNELGFKPDVKYGGGLGAGIVNGKGKYHRIMIKPKFEILGCDNLHCHNDFPDTKKYDAYKEIRQDGTLTGCSGNKTNEKPMLTGKPEKGNYFINDEGREVYSKYRRLFIKKVNEDGVE